MGNEDELRRIEELTYASHFKLGLHEQFSTGKFTSFGKFDETGKFGSNHLHVATFDTSHPL